MSEHWYSRLGRAALISAALLFAAGASLAKAPGHGGGGGGHGGGGHGGGGHGGGGHSGGFSGGGRAASFSSGAGRSFSPSAASFSGRTAPAGVSRTSNFAPATAGATHTWNGSSNWSHNGSWNHNGHHDGHHDGHHNNFNNGFFFWGFPFYSSWFWGYPYPYFYGGFPRWYYWNDYAYDPGPAYYTTPDGNYSVAQQQPAPQQPADMPKLDDNAVLIAVRVPESAVIWFDGDKTTQTGSLREFITPVLEPGQRYTYEIKAQWVENGQEVVRTRKMDIYAGDRLMVNFMAPGKSAPPKPAPLKAPTPAPPAPAPSNPVP